MPSIQKGGKYTAALGNHGFTYCFGTFQEYRRALICERVARHWLCSGYKMSEIPRKPKTVDAI